VVLVSIGGLYNLPPVPCFEHAPHIAVVVPVGVYVELILNSLFLQNMATLTLKLLLDEPVFPILQQLFAHEILRLFVEWPLKKLRATPDRLESVVVTHFFVEVHHDLVLQLVAKVLIEQVVLIQVVR
jgi:hypothetical protein